MGDTVGPGDQFQIRQRAAELTQQRRQTAIGQAEGAVLEQGAVVVAATVAQAIGPERVANETQRAFKRGNRERHRASTGTLSRARASSASSMSPISAYIC